MRWENTKGTIELTFASSPRTDSPLASELIQSGLAHHQAGRWQEAEAIYQSILQEQPQHPDALHLLGVIAHQKGKHEIAVNLIENAIKINPTISDFYNNRGEAYRALHKNDLAINSYEQALTIKPNYAKAHYNLAVTLQELGRLEDAIAHYERALTIKPDYAKAHNNLGFALQGLGRLENAITHYQQALAFKSNYAEAHYNLGNALKELGLQEDAVASYERALTIKPDYAKANNNLGIAMQELGRREDAIAHYEQALAIKPDYAEAQFHLTMIKPSQEQISIIEKRLTSQIVSEKDAILYNYSLGKLFDNAKSFTKAFEHYLRANTLKRKSVTYDSQNHSIHVDRLIEVHSKRYFQEKTACGSDSELPVFIVGMPRSGTSLVEQIVSSHPQVYGAGELKSIGQIERKITKKFEALKTYPKSMSLCNASIASKYSAKYLKQIGVYSQDATRITDKTPNNFLRIGLIKTLFPNARIIHCQRNALDTCMSIFFNNFAVGNDYSFDLTELGKYYLDYERLMAHWNKLFPTKIDIQVSRALRWQ